MACSNLQTEFIRGQRVKMYTECLKNSNYRFYTRCLENNWIEFMLVVFHKKFWWDEASSYQKVYLLVKKKFFWTTRFGNQIWGRAALKYIYLIKLFLISKDSTTNCPIFYCNPWHTSLCRILFFSCSYSFFFNATLQYMG